MGDASSVSTKVHFAENYATALREAAIRSNTPTRAGLRRDL